MNHASPFQRCLRDLPRGGKKKGTRVAPNISDRLAAMAAVGTSPGNPYAKKKVRVVTSDSPIHALQPLQSSSVSEEIIIF
jgi:hypothetical protein